MLLREQKGTKPCFQPLSQLPSSRSIDIKMSAKSLWSALIACLPLSLLASFYHYPLTSEHVSDSPFTASVDAFIVDTLASWHTAGIAIAVVTGHDTWTKVGQWFIIFRQAFSRFSILFVYVPHLCSER